MLTDGGRAVMFTRIQSNQQGRYICETNYGSVQTVETFDLIVTDAQVTDSHRHSSALYGFELQQSLTCLSPGYRD